MADDRMDFSAEVAATGYGKAQHAACAWVPTCGVCVVVTARMPGASLQVYCTPREALALGEALREAARIAERNSVTVGVFSAPDVGVEHG